MEGRLQTPVALFIFNRPETTEKVFEQIALAKPAQLLVVADGPRPGRPGETERCAAARAIIERVDWSCQVLTNYAEHNLGCKRRVSSGLDWVFETVERAIILEDDCLPHPSFFRFCAELLEKYQDDERVMMISGMNYLLQFDIPESYLFSRYFPVWGWASWRRAWQKYDIQMADWAEFKAKGHLSYLFPHPYAQRLLISMFDSAYDNQVDTWDVQWVYSCVFNHGLCLTPRVNLISNIGLSGTHTLSPTVSNPFLFMPTYNLEVEPIQHPVWVFANRVYDEAVFDRIKKVTLMTRVKSKFNSLKQVIKKSA
jgi:hypothetical protein